MDTTLDELPVMQMQCLRKSLACSTLIATLETSFQRGVHEDP
jgi:hypothetical protein